MPYKITAAKSKKSVNIKLFISRYTQCYSKDASRFNHKINVTIQIPLFSVKPANTGNDTLISATLESILRKINIH